jgi:type IV pilus assembly protein PilQ
VTGKNMQPLLKNQFKNLYLGIVCLIILTIFFFPSCAAKKNQNIQDSDTDAKQMSEANSDMGTAMDQTADKSTITAVKLLRKSDSTEIIIEGNTQLKYTSIKQSFPFGIAIYLPETILGEKLTSFAPETGDISNIIPSYADKDKKTAKIEILLNKDLSYKISREENNLQVILPGGKLSVKTNNDKLKKDKLVTETNALKIPKGIADLSDIEFKVEDEGNTELTLVTSHPIKYDFSKGSKGILYLNLYKTTIPKKHKRPFETKYFKSAVHRVLPLQKMKNDKNSKIEISMREKVPYQVVQNNNIITVRFEPSSIEPPKFTKADKTPSDKIVPNAITEQPQNTTFISQPVENSKVQMKEPKGQAKYSKASQSEVSAVAIAPVNPNYPSEKKINTSRSKEKIYTGEKIKLDFYETDIKNVFRILSSISNKNFAIDKDVTGNVTLTLDNPIPWDQVLDLVLSMNQLEKEEQGSVIRIATHATLAKEAQQRHTRFEAMRKAEKELDALEPLTTEYIPINYANASKDILPHIKNILTKDRGTASVDSRTNMLIITDTKTKVEKAKILIYTLDNVTPQIMISAKIVEANKEFSRGLGLGLNIGFNEDTAAHGNDNYNVALNSPATASSPSNNASFSFHNFMGGHGENIFGPGTAFLTATINASESKGDVSVLSSPKILTLDNKKATIKQGLEYPYTVVDEDGKVTVEFKEIDLLLEVTPHVTPDKRISMEIFVTKNEIAGDFVAGVPPVSTNEANTTLLVNNNDTIVIGGVLKSYQKEGKSGFPFLMDIPLLGRLFRTDNIENDKQELLIFLTPSIVQLKQKKNELSLEQTLE